MLEQERIPAEAAEIAVKSAFFRFESPLSGLGLIRTVIVANSMVDCEKRERQSQSFDAAPCEE